MKVCLICEGCYPYVPGGVSSWVQTLCEEIKDVEFVIWSIATTKKEMSDIRYNVPMNVKEIRTMYIGENNLQNNHKNITLSQQDKNTLKTLILGLTDEVNWQDILDFIMRHRKQLEDILMSEVFYDICLEEYKRQKSKLCFFNFLWNFRAMYSPLIHILSNDIPQADIYHSVSTGYAGILAASASYVQNKPLIITEHGIYTREREEDIIRSGWIDKNFKDAWIQFFKKLSFISYKQASTVTALFEVNKGLQIELGCSPEKIKVIPNGINVINFENLPNKHNLPDGNFNVGTILRVVPIKDVKNMILAYELARDSVPNLKLYIMGNCDEDKDYYNECLELIATLGIKGVVFLGLVNIKDYLPEMDLLLLSSISEGQPLGIMEGMAAGIPFIATNVGDCAQLLSGETQGQRAGLIVPVMDSDAMAKAIVYCFNNPKECQQMGANGNNKIKQYYTQDAFIERYKNLYNTALKK